MKKSKALRLAGFAGALCTAGALLGTSVASTGAYFTDSHSGQINTSTGSVRVTVSPEGGQLNFTNLLPGEDQTQRITYTAQGSGAEDIWLVFPTDGGADAFLHTPQAGPAPLGRYGHFGLSSTGGASFNSYNLSASPSGYNSSDSCTIDANGEGGSNAQISSPSDTLPYCAPRPAILLQSNMTNGAAGNADLTFGFTKLLTNGAGNGNELASANPLVKYRIVATQHGISPTDAFNG